jgi:hypothetical protein
MFFNDVCKLSCWSTTGDLISWSREFTILKSDVEISPYPYAELAPIIVTAKTKDNKNFIASNFSFLDLNYPK